jgi:hypothetical protein
MIDEYQVVDEVARETADKLRATDAILVWQADGDGAFVVEPADD